MRRLRDEFDVLVAPRTLRLSVLANVTERESRTPNCQAKTLGFELSMDLRQQCAAGGQRSRVSPDRRRSLRL